MTTLSFPGSPNIGTVYEAPNNTLYIYDGEKWNVQGSTVTTAASINFVQDSVAPLLTNIQGDGITFSYNDQTNTLFATVTGYVGTVGENSVGNGYTGSRGYNGSAGTNGYTGSAGTNGTNGFTGSIGFTGSSGAASAIGYTGSKGDSGSIGYTGSTGAGYTGSVGTDGYTGSKGDFGYSGSKGDNGFTGSVGTDGYTGSKGDFGYTGSKGDIGYTGSFGDFGYTGSQGYQGYTGSRGATNQLVSGNFTISLNSITGILSIPAGISFPDTTYQSTAWTGSNPIDYRNIINIPVPAEIDIDGGHAIAFYSVPNAADGGGSSQRFGPNSIVFDGSNANGTYTDTLDGGGA